MKYLKIFTDFLDVMDPLTDEEAGRLYRAMLGYAKDGSEAELSGNERFLWTVAKQHIDRERAAYDEKVKHLKRGNVPVTRKNDPVSGEDNDNDKYNDKYKEKDNERVCMSAAGAASRTHTMPPSLEEIEAYCQERGNQVNAQRFLDFYTANGWKIGKVPMRDWKAAVRSWESNGMGEARTAPAKEKLTDRELFQRAIELHRMKEAKEV